MKKKLLIAIPTILLALLVTAAVFYWLNRYEAIPPGASTSVGSSDPGGTEGRQPPPTEPPDGWMRSGKQSCDLACLTRNSNGYQEERGTPPPSPDQLQRVMTTADRDGDRSLSEAEALTVAPPDTWTTTAVPWSFDPGKMYSRDEFLTRVQGFQAYHGQRRSPESAVHEKFDRIQRENGVSGEVTGEISGEWLNNSGHPGTW